MYITQNESNFLFIFQTFFSVIKIKFLHQIARPSSVVVCTKPSSNEGRLSTKQKTKFQLILNIFFCFKVFRFPFKFTIWKSFTFIRKSDGNLVVSPCCKINHRSSRQTSLQMHKCWTIIKLKIHRIIPFKQVQNSQNTMLIRNHLWFAIEEFYTRKAVGQKMWILRTLNIRYVSGKRLKKTRSTLKLWKV